MDRPNDKVIEQVDSSTRRIRMGCGSVYRIMDEHDGQPLRLFLKKGHGGLCEQALMEAVGRLLTILIQRTDVDMRRVCKSLNGITCDQGMAGKVSCLDVLAKELKKRYPEPESEEGADG